MKISKWLLWAAALLSLAFLVYQIPWVNFRLGWRLDAAQAYARGVIDPVEDLPAPEILLSPASETAEPPLAVPSPTAQASPTALPASAQLAAPAFELQGPNNCGPATLSMYLKYYRR